MAFRPYRVLSLLGLVTLSCNSPADMERLQRGASNEPDLVRPPAPDPEDDRLCVIPDDEPQVKEFDIVDHKVPIERDPVTGKPMPLGWGGDMPPPREEGDPREGGLFGDPDFNGGDPKYPGTEPVPAPTGTKSATRPDPLAPPIFLPISREETFIYKDSEMEGARAAAVSGTPQVVQAPSCSYPMRECDGNPATSCETNVWFNPNHCAWCGRVCPVLANTLRYCFFGFCIYKCAPGYRNCDGYVPNGCEVNVESDSSNCGSCGNVCGGGSSCSGGACSAAPPPAPSCISGTADCNGDPADGCETNTDTSTGNCGTCGNVCSFANAGALCSSGVCGLGACLSSFGNCDAAPANGCEIDTGSSTSNCGACGTVCSFANAGALCSSGVCGLGACVSGFGNCDSMSANGCEADTTSNVSHCGACGNVCSFANAAAGCAIGACQLGACDSGFGNCDAMASNGCETVLGTPTSCGGCGIACTFPNASGLCSGGTTCSINACNPGFENCDGVAANGCETNTQTDPSNCGGCGLGCDGACMSGMCL